MQRGLGFSVEGQKRGSAVIEVICGSNKLHLSARYARELEVVVAARALNRGDIVTRQDLKLKTVLENEVRGSWHTDTDALVGQSAKRNIQPGQPVTDRMVEAPKLIDRGDSVKIVAGDGGIQITVMGTALSDGKEGQQINVKNNASGRTVRGLVIAQGLVQMP